MRIGIDENSGIYTFNPTARTIEIDNLPFNLSLNQLQIIYNVTDGIPLFNFASGSALGATISNNIITLNTDTSSMSADDSLLIQVAEPSDRIKIGRISELLSRLINLVNGFPWVDKSANQVRAQVTGTISTVTTVTTCTTATNLSQLDTYPASLLVRNNSLTVWYNSVRGRIS